MIDRNSPIPIYYQLKQLIKRQIQSKALRSGDRLPTERELCEQHRISRAPVRQALTALAQEGYIYRRAGAGTFVSESSSRPRETSEHFRLLANDVRWISLLERTVQHWNEQNPDRAIVLDVEMPPRSEFHQNLRSAAVQGNAPDIVSLDYVWMTDYARSSYLTPLDSLDPDWTAWLRQELEPPVEHNHVIDEQLFGLPMQTDVTGLWYRRDWFEAEGVEPPTTWEEWDALLEHFSRAEVLRRYGHRWALAAPTTTTAGEATVNTLMPALWNAGGDLLDEEGKLCLDSAPVHRALTFLQSLTGRYLPHEAATFEWWEPPHMLAEGQVAMILGGTYEWPMVSEISGWETESDLQRYLGFVPLPRPDPNALPTTSLGGTTWVILQQSKMSEISLELMKLAVSCDWITEFYEETLQISPLKSINRTLKDAHPWMEGVLPLMEIARPRPMLRSYLQVSRFLQQMFELILWQGAPVESTVKQTANYLALLLTE